jgi:outer membrane receptor protein involved in Fe transport
MKFRLSQSALCALSLALAVQAAFAAEEATGVTDAEKDSSSTSEKDKIEEVIVTGVTRETLKKDATSSISTLTDEDIRRLAPISTADLLQNVPGVFAEGSTAGEASNNITVRGLPVTGGYRYAPQLIDGMPWYEEPEVQFMNNDVAVRDDLMTKRVEVVKGGTGSILYSNGLGATFNHVTRTGSQQFEGGYRLEVTDYNLVRNEYFLSGPINDNLTYAVGGFYRTSDGIRDTGYTADRGGQLRGNIVFTSDDNRTEMEFHALAINDRTAFYQNVPFQVPAFTQPGTPDNPIKIDTDHIYELGIDFRDGTVASPYNRSFRQLGEYGERQIDLADGNHADFDILTVKLKHEFDSGWTSKADLRHSSGSNGFNAMFTGNDSTSASRFLSARYQNDIVSPALGQALRGDYDAAKLAGFFNVPDNASEVFPGISRQELVANYAKATGVGAFYVDDGSRVPDDQIVNFLLPFIAVSDADSTSVDLQTSKAFELLGEHELTLGVYASDYAIDQNFQSSLLVSTMERQSRLVELRGLDGAGQVVGPSLTYQGAMLPGYFGYVSDISVKGRALYFLDHWETFDDRLKFDFGVRWQNQKANVVRRDRNIIAGSDMTPASVEPGSLEDTTADNEVFLPGSPRILHESFDALGWSVGGNYSVAPNAAVYGLVSRSFRLPSLEDLNEFRVDSSIPGSKIERIMQYEVGLRYYADTWDTQIAVFQNDFSPRDNVVTYRDFESPDCAVEGGVPDINSCPEVREFYKRGVKNLGMEIEVAWRPRLIEGLEVRAVGLIQRPEIVDANYRTVKEIRENDVVTGYTYENIGENGRTPRRLAEEMFNVQASYDLKPLTGIPLKPYAKYSYFGERFSESQDINVTLYPAYFHIDAGFIWDITHQAAFQFHVANLTNELSFTEGDPLFADLKGPNGATNRGVGRPLFGRTMRASFTYFF